MLESEGFKYISTPRPTGWGGAAIIVNQEDLSLKLTPYNEKHWSNKTLKNPLMKKN